MKILKVNIQNFGRLSEIELNFENDLTVINEDNGWGKTTLTDFIKVMLYDFSGQRKAELKENLRKKYQPWQGGTYGGSLDFEYKNNKYRVMKTFGDTPKKDSFELLNLKNNKKLEHYPNTNEKIVDNGKMLGYYLLGLNEEAYNRTVFLSQNSSTHEIKSEDINEKLSALLGGEVNGYNYKTVIEKVDKRVKEYKRNTATGIIYPLKQKKLELEKQIELGIKDRENLNENLDKISMLNKDVNNLTNQINNIKAKIVIIQKNSEFASLKRHVTEAGDRLSAAKQSLNNIKHVFKGNEPNKQEVNNLISAINSLEYKKQNSNLALRVQQLENDLQNLKQFFSKKLPTSSELEVLQENIAKYNVLKGQNKSSLSNAQKSNNGFKKSTLAIMVIIPAILLLIGGFVYANNSQVGLAILVATIITTVLVYSGLIVVSKTKSKNHKTESKTIAYTTTDSKVNEIRESIVKYLALFYSANDINNTRFYDLHLDLFNKFNTYSNNLVFYEKAKSESIEFDEQVQKQQLEIEKMLDSYNVDELGDYNEIKNYINSNFEKFVAETRLLTERESDYNKLLSQLKELESSADNMPKDSLEDLQENERVVAENIKELVQEVTKIKTLNVALEQSFNKLPVLETELDEVIEQIAEKEYELTVFEQTYVFLQSAEDAVTSKYITPIKTVFEEMTGKILTEGFSDVLINSDLEIRLQNYGINYEFDYYSAGYKDIINLIMRLSLAKVLFTDTKPFVVLDDPFVNADPDKLNKALNVLKDLSKEFQIIYLTCHPSRAI